MKTIKKTLTIVVLAIAALIPTYVFYFVNWIVGPEGFWEKFAMYVAGGICLGGLQIMLIILALHAYVYITNKEE